MALTFDAGGNSAGLTSKSRSTLQGRQAGTFFLTGRWAEANPAQAAQIARYYPVGDHSYSHPVLTTLADDAVRTEVGRGHTAILTASGRTPVRCSACPFGARDAGTIAIVNSLELRQRAVDCRHARLARAPRAGRASIRSSGVCWPA